MRIQTLFDSPTVTITKCDFIVQNIFCDSNETVPKYLVCKIDCEKHVCLSQYNRLLLLQPRLVPVYFWIIPAIVFTKMESGKSSSWFDEDTLPTADPNILVTVVAEDLPTLTVMTIVGVTLVILVAIVAVFLLGVLIDCRQQRIIDEKMGEVKRLKKQRRLNLHREEDGASIAYNMEEPGMSVPPAEALRDIP